MDPYPLVGWRRIESEDGELVALEGPNGERCEDEHQAYEHDIASKKAAQSNWGEAQKQLTFLQKFLNDHCSESVENEEQQQRTVVTTSTLEDWLFRGDHPILAPMSFEVYCMWVFRIEKPFRKSDQRKRHRFIDIPFAPHYAMRDPLAAFGN